ncbi:hypothetical protein [Rhodococcus olei]
MKVTARVVRDDECWLTYVPEVDRYTHAHHTGVVQTMAQDLVQVMLGERLERIEVAIEWPEELAAPVREFERLQVEAERARNRAAQAQRDQAPSLQEQGVPLRDSGALLHVSLQRVHQLLQPSLRSEDTRWWSGSKMCSSARSGSGTSRGRTEGPRVACTSSSSVPGG